MEKTTFDFLKELIVFIYFFFMRPSFTQHNIIVFT